MNGGSAASGKTVRLMLDCEPTSIRMEGPLDGVICDLFACVPLEQQPEVLDRLHAIRKRILQARGLA